MNRRPPRTHRSRQNTVSILERYVTATILLLFVSACDSERPPQSTSTTTFGLAVLSPPVTVIFGELHGTREAPSYFGRVVRDVLSNTEVHVSVGLEIPATFQDGLESFLESPGDTASREKLLENEFWRRRMQDGRSSNAMLALIEEMRKLNMLHPDRLTVVAIDGQHANYEVKAYAGGRDEMLAANVTAIASANSRGVSVVLVGNAHSRRRPLNGMDYLQPMAAFLEIPVTTVLLLPSGGSSWNCIAECDVHAVGGLGRHPDSLEAAKDEGLYDFVVDLGPVSASLPAVGKLGP